MFGNFCIKKLKQKTNLMPNSEILEAFIVKSGRRHYQQYYLTFFFPKSIRKAVLHRKQLENNCFVLSHNFYYQASL